MNLQQLYSETVSPQIKEEFSIQNIHLIPKIAKVTVNVGLGEAVQNPKSIDQAWNTGDHNESAARLICR